MKNKNQDIDKYIKEINSRDIVHINLEDILTILRALKMADDFIKYNPVSKIILGFCEEKEIDVDINKYSEIYSEIITQLKVKGLIKIEEGS